MIFNYYELMIPCIKAALESDRGALIGRNGTIELEQMIQVTPGRLPILERNAGIFPIAVHSIFYQWQKESIEATKSADILAAGWYEPLKEAEALMLEKWNVKALQVPLRTLEPYYVQPEEQWTKLLEGHSVAVVTSFTETAKKQIEKGSAIWGSHGVLPSPDSVDWHWIQTGHPSSLAQGQNEWPDRIHSWFQAANYVVREVMKSGARFALIGCGGLGMPIARMLKDRGVIAIVMGGAIQVLFGIKGKRWEKHPVISTFWNDAWVWPSKEETPGGADAIEGGCYWG
jgi:hypothetical protein